METKTETTNLLTVRSAGRTLKGSAHSANSEYICYINYSGPGRVRGLYGIAKGLSGDKGKASELVIETLKESFRHVRESDSVNGCNLLPGCLEEIHSVLLNQKTGEDQSGSTAALICSYIEGDTAHIALAGGGAAYIIENGKISRLTEDKGSLNLAETDPNLLKPGQIPVGFTGGEFKPLFMSQHLNPDSTLLFCSDGLIARLNSATIQDTIATSTSLDKAAEQLVEKAHKRDDTGDVGIVLADFASTEQGKRLSQSYSIHYPFSIYIWKYLIVTLLIVALGILFIRGTDYLRPKNEGRVRNFQVETSVRANTPSGTKADVSTVLAGPTAELKIQTEQPNARVFIDGVQQTGGPIFILTITAERDVELRVEAESAEPYIEIIRAKEGDKLERIINLRAPRPKNGSLLVLCRPQCDYMSLDGRSIDGFPKDEIILREISPGTHKILARLNGETESRSLRIVSGITQSIVFRFGGEKIKPRAETSEPRLIKPGAQQHEQNDDTEIVRTRPDTEKSDVEQIKKVPTTVASSKPAIKTAFFMVDSNVSDCTIMLYKNNQLVMTGFSGTRYDVKPGRYLLNVSKIGYEEAQREVLLDKDYQVMHFDLKKQQD